MPGILLGGRSLHSPSPSLGTEHIPAPSGCTDLHKDGEHQHFGGQGHVGAIGMGDVRPHYGAVLVVPMALHGLHSLHQPGFPPRARVGFPFRAIPWMDRGGRRKQNEERAPALPTPAQSCSPRLEEGMEVLGNCWRQELQGQASLSYPGVPGIHEITAPIPLFLMASKRPLGGFVPELLAWWPEDSVGATSSTDMAGKVQIGPQDGHSKLCFRPAHPTSLHLHCSVPLWGPGTGRTWRCSQGWSPQLWN